MASSDSEVKSWSGIPEKLGKAGTVVLKFAILGDFC